ncbi:MAG: RNA-binding protein [Mariprofundus sp.]|nr:RNA-binding protein [Mariprofundus sp.]
MSFSCLIKLFAVAIAASLVGYYALSAINPQGVPVASLFATGITLGVIFGGLLVALVPAPSAAQPTKSGTSNLYVGNLPFNAGMDDVKNLFSPFGDVVDVRLVKDRRSKRFKGYGFVEMDTAGALEAIKRLDGNDYAGRTLRVNEAKKKGED